jgi:hypothetical protein
MYGRCPEPDPAVLAHGATYNPAQQAIAARLPRPGLNSRTAPARRDFLRIPPPQPVAAYRQYKLLILLGNYWGMV